MKEGKNEKTIPEAIRECDTLLCNLCAYGYLLNVSDDYKYIYEACPVRKLFQKVESLENNSPDHFVK